MTFKYLMIRFKKKILIESNVAYEHLQAAQHGLSNIE